MYTHRTHDFIRLWCLSKKSFNRSG